jgi:hypothetical protein
MEPMLSLAFSMHTNPGVYALLLGSGVSRAAEIPTGWEVVTDLIRQLAAARGEDCSADPEGWYTSAFDEEPDYSKLLRTISKRPAERQTLLRSYFEASPEDEAAGRKQPTKAHKAIAELARTGHVKVIITTNFDRLIERSLEAVGVSPTVISSADAVEGAVPLTHARCTVIKLHGDYLDARIKNTADELAKYDRRMNRLLDRVLDEFGLVICGWSGDWDIALRAAMERCKSRRFTTFWAAKGAPSEAARRLIEHRAAELISIIDADQFFAELHQKVDALAQSGRPHPLSAKTAVATMKRLLADPRHRIELHDLIRGEVERVVSATTDERMPVSGGFRPTTDDVRKRIEQYDAITETLRSLVITGCYWGGEEHQKLWVALLERLANKPSTGGATALIELRRYPALLTLYAAGLAAIAKQEYVLLKALLLGPVVQDSRRSRPIMDSVYPSSIIEQRLAQEVFGRSSAYTPVSDHLYELLRDSLRDYLPDDERYAEAFDRFEYLWAIVAADDGLHRGTTEEFIAFPLGRFAWRRDFSETDSAIASVLRQERAAAEAAGTPLLAGLVPSLERFDAADRAVKRRLGKVHWY